jgi:hypothetical protein
MNLHETQLSDVVPAPEPRVRFTYASGSRPLDGYTIKRGVGRGGFGEVYYAVSDGGKEVALKLVRRNLDVELRGVGQCLNLKHAHLVALYDVRHDAQDDAWVVMEYVSGEGLDRAIARSPQGLTAPEVLEWIHGIGAGVAYLHDKGVVHRDLKPGNIFLDEGVVKIGDYGLSKFISASRRSGQTESVGTVHYMAPEVANGRYGKEIDIYALGIMLYEMLTGHVPFEGESVGEVLMKHLTAAPDTSQLAEPYRTVVTRALAKDPDQRYASVAEFLAPLPRPAGAAPLVAAAAPAARGPAPVRAAAAPAAAAIALRAPAQAQPPADDEPVWRAVRESWRQLSEAWRRANFGTPVKVLLIVGAVFLLLNTSAVTVPAVVCLLIVYGAYRLARALLLTKAGGTSAAAVAAPPPSPFAAAPPAQAAVASAPQVGATPFAPSAPLVPAEVLPAADVRRSHRLRWHARAEQPVPALLLKRRKERLAELLSSLLLSAGAALVIGLVLALLLEDGFQLNQFAWLAVVGTAGSWAVLIPSKAWEGTHGEPILRRFVLLLAGLAVGCVAWGAQQFLLVQLPWSANLQAEAIRVNVEPVSYFSQGMFQADGAPLLKGFLAYFGFLFPVLRWWRQADPARNVRLSIWSVVVCGLWAWLLSEFWRFPQPWGIMVAATVAISVQLASPWLDLRRRTNSA